MQRDRNRDDINDLIRDLQSLTDIASERSQLSAPADRNEAITLGPEALARLDGMLREGEKREHLLSVAIEREFERRQHKVYDLGTAQSSASKGFQSRTIHFAFACVTILSFMFSLTVVLGCVALFFLSQEPFLGRINF